MYLITFYICACLVILVIINIVYVAISFSKNKFSVMWPLGLLRALISFLVTVLFLPIFGNILIKIFEHFHYIDTFFYGYFLQANMNNFIFLICII